MNKIIVFGLVAALFVGVGVFVRQQYVQPKYAESTSVDPSKVDDVDVVVTQDFQEETIGQVKSRYVEYSKGVFDQVADTRRVLFFYASWCPTCRPADLDFKANIDKIPNDVTVLRVNYNDTDTDTEEKELAKEYAITYQHTYVQIDAQGKILKIWNGGKFAEMLKNLQ